LALRQAVAVKLLAHGLQFAAGQVMEEGEVSFQVIDFGRKVLAPQGVEIGLSRIIQSKGEDERGSSGVGHGQEETKRLGLREAAQLR
jgi:hypothetical protein